MYSQDNISGQYFESVQPISTAPQENTIPPDLLPFFIIERAEIDHFERESMGYLRIFNKTRGLQESWTLYLLKDKLLNPTWEPLVNLTTTVETKTIILPSQYLGNLEKIEPLCIQDTGLYSNVEEIIRNLKRPQGTPYLLSLAGKLDGPKDLSENKRKYLAKNVNSKPKK